MMIVADRPTTNNTHRTQQTTMTPPPLPRCSIYRLVLYCDRTLYPNQNFKKRNNRTESTVVGNREKDPMNFWRKVVSSISLYILV